MLFVPLPLFVTFSLLILLARMIWAGDNGTWTSRLFVAGVALYAVQSFLLCLRWGYGVDAVAPFIAIVATLLPIVAYLAFRSLIAPLGRSSFLLLLIPFAGIVVRVIAPDAFDLFLLTIFVGFGIVLVRMAARGSDTLALARISGAVDATRAMTVTGLFLIGSAAMDVFVIVDFIRTNGQNIGLTITFVQAVSLLGLGAMAVVGQSGAVPVDDVTRPGPATPDKSDEEIIARILAMFETQKAHLDPDLNLRRLARKLGLPDRAVSQAINRVAGVNVSQYVNAARVGEAKTLIETTDQSILQISLAAGFMTKSNFNREFVRVAGVTPSAWREKGRAVAQP